MLHDSTCSYTTTLKNLKLFKLPFYWLLSTSFHAIACLFNFRQQGQFWSLSRVVTTAAFWLLCCKHTTSNSNRDTELNSLTHFLTTVRWQTLFSKIHQIFLNICINVLWESKYQEESIFLVAMLQVTFFSKFLFISNNYRPTSSSKNSRIVLKKIVGRSQVTSYITEE